MSSAYCSSAVAVSAAATVSSAATFNPLLSFHSNFKLFYRITPKPFKLVAKCPTPPLFLHLNTRRHRLFCAAEDEIPPSSGEEEDEEEEENEEEDADATQASVEEGRLYVGNLPYTITSSELSQLFGEAGNVVDVQVRQIVVPKCRALLQDCSKVLTFCLQIVYDKVTDRSRGFGFVTMGTIEEAKEAIQMFNSSVKFPSFPF